jgi:hypothetical protein
MPPPLPPQGGDMSADVVYGERYEKENKGKSERKKKKRNTI